jgi:tetratricopeptide (TPR) repeat protein
LTGTPSVQLYSSGFIELVQLVTSLPCDACMPDKKPIGPTEQTATEVLDPTWKRVVGSPLFISLCLALATFAIFSSVTQHEFVNYDDPDYITSNSHVQGGLTPANIGWAFKTGHASNWHPLTWLSHMLDCQLFGQRAAMHHLMNVVFHTSNAVMLFLLLKRLTGAPWRSAFVAAAFAWHPLHVESVAWASERKDVLSTFFFILTIWVYVKYVGGRQESGVRSQEPEIRGQGSLVHGPVVRGPVVWYVLALVLFALGLMSKPMLVTTPFVLLLLDYWPLHRFEISNLKVQLPTLGRLILEKIPFFALSIGSSVVTYYVQRKGGAVSTSISLGGRLLNAVVAYALYIRNTFFPHDLAVLYPHPGQWGATYLLGSAILLAAIFAVVIAAGPKRPYLITGWFWFLGTLIPAIGLVQVGVQSMADRYTYIPLIGLFIMLAWGVSDVLARFGWGKKVLATGAGLTLASCACLTIHQLGYWQNSEILFRHAAGVTRNNYLAYNNLGYYLSGRGEIQEAMDNYRKALEINPQYEDAYNNMGYALAALKKYPEAIAHYQAALRIRPKHAEVHNNLGNALADIGHIDEAIAHYRIVLEQQPEHADAHNNLGIALAMKGNFPEAIEHFHAAIRYKPGYASAHSNLGNAFAVQHKLDEAIAEYRQSLLLNPKDAQAHNNLGNALTERGELAEAVRHYEDALKLNADNPEANFNLGMTLRRQGKTNDAIMHFREALRLKPDYQDAKRQLGELVP